MTGRQRIRHTGNINGMVVGGPAFFPGEGASGQLSGATIAVGENKMLCRGFLVS
jgi:hypothetical protein